MRELWIPFTAIEPPLPIVNCAYAFCIDVSSPFYHHGYAARFDINASNHLSIGWSMYIAGSSYDYVQGGVARYQDSNGKNQILLTGFIDSDDFPLVLPYQTATSPRSAFVVRIDE